MKKLLLAAAISCVSTAHAAESSLLRDIMGADVYEESGLTELSPKQLRVLEDWVVNNAVDKHTVTRKSAPNAVKEKTVAKEAPPEPAVTKGVADKVKHDVEPRYVRMSEESPETSEEEPATQKYVRIESLQEQDRMVEPDLIRSRIDGKFKGWRNNKTRFRLENGEIWEQRQTSTFITNLDSPEVIIRKRRFGYTMEVPVVGKKVHVKRIR